MLKPGAFRCLRFLHGISTWLWESRPGAPWDNRVCLQFNHPEVGSEPPTGGRGKPDPLWQDRSPSVAIFMQVFYLFFKYCQDPIGRTWTLIIFLVTVFWRVLFWGPYNLEFMEKSRIWVNSLSFLGKNDFVGPWSPESDRGGSGRLGFRLVGSIRPRLRWTKLPLCKCWGLGEKFWVCHSLGGDLPRGLRSAFTFSQVFG